MRRNLLKLIALASALLSVTGAAVAQDNKAPKPVSAPSTGRVIQMQTAFNPALPGSGEGVRVFTRTLKHMTAGAFAIKIVEPGRIAPTADMLDAIVSGDLEAAFTWSGYAASKAPVFNIFATVPFGLGPEDMTSWMLEGDGSRIHREAYDKLGVAGIPCGIQGPKGGGWFRGEVNTVADFKGLKMRIPGLGGQVVTKLGGSVVLMAGGEIFPALERGVIDASEWIGPHDDLKLGLQKTARYYYYPGWHEPGTTLEFGFNKRAYDALPIDLRRIVDHASVATWAYTIPEWEAKNAIALEKLRSEYKSQVEILALPTPILRDLRKVSAEVVRQESEKSPMARRVYASFTKFQAQVAPWGQLSEGAYQRLIAG